MTQLFEVYGPPEAFPMDNDPEIKSKTFTEWTKEKGIALLFISLASPIRMHLLRDSTEALG